MSNFITNLFRSKKKLTIDEWIVKKTITSFFFLFLFFAGCVWAWKWIRKQPLDDGIRGGIQQPLRNILNTNEDVFNKIFSKKHLAKTYPVSAATKNVRFNGSIGLGNDFDPATWELYVIKKNGDTLLLKLDDIKKLPNDRRNPAKMARTRPSAQDLSEAARIYVNVEQAWRKFFSFRRKVVTCTRLMC